MIVIEATPKIQGFASELDKWNVVTSLCASLEIAEVAAERILPQTNHIRLEPLKQGQWLVIASLPILVN